MIDVIGKAFTGLFLCAIALVVAFAGVSSHDDPHALGTFHTQGLVYQFDQISPQALDGCLGPGEQDNYAPAGLADHTFIEICGNDPHGTLVTGLEATGIAIGDVRWLCNLNGTSNGSTIVLSTEDSASLPNNRFWIPVQNNTTTPGEIHPDRYSIDPQTCQPLVYAQPMVGDPTYKRWIVVGGSAQQYRDIVESLQLYPDNQPAAITGTVVDFNPTNVCPDVGGPSAGSCENGGSTSADDYTVYILTTVDASGATIAGLLYRGTGGAWTSSLGPLKLLANFGPGPITLENLGAGNSDSHDQILFASGHDTILYPGASILLYHSSHTNNWTPIGEWAFDWSTLPSNTIPVSNQVSGPVMKGSKLHDDGTTFDYNTTSFTVTTNGDGTFSRNLQASMFIASPRLVPPAISGSITNFAPTDFHTSGMIALTTAGAATISGANGGFDGENHWLCNFGPDPITIVNLGTTTGGAAQFWTADAVFAYLPPSSPGSCVQIQYSSANGKWLEVGGTTVPTMQRGTPSANHGTPAAGASDYSGTITGIGANTSVTLTFSIARTTSFCQATTATGNQHINVTQSGSAPVFACIDNASGAAANCVDFTYLCPLI